MTRIRAMVLKHLSGMEKPRSALDVAQDLKSHCDQATVYRALHWLETRGQLESFVLHCHAHGTERYYIHCERAHRHWFHCVSCHAFIDLGACTLESNIRQWERSRGLTVQAHALQVTGLCGDCQTRNVNPATHH